MSNAAMEVFKRRELAKLAGLEQDMVTGEDAEGKSLKNLIGNIPPLLTDSNIEYLFL